MRLGAAAVQARAQATAMITMTARVTPKLTPPAAASMAVPAAAASVPAAAEVAQVAPSTDQARSCWLKAAVLDREVPPLLPVLLALVLVLRSVFALRLAHSAVARPLALQLPMLRRERSGSGRGPPRLPPSLLPLRRRRHAATPALPPPQPQLRAQ